MMFGVNLDQERGRGGGIVDMELLDGGTCARE